MNMRTTERRSQAIATTLILATVAACGGQPMPPLPDFVVGDVICAPDARYIAYASALPGASSAFDVTIESAGAVVLVDLGEIGARAVCAPAEARASMATAGVRLAPDGRVGIPPGETRQTGPRAMAVVPQWHLAKVGAPAAWARSRGRGVVVHVIDTGADGTHPAFAGRIVGGVDYVGGRPCGPGIDCDGEGHGTHVAATVAEVLDSGQPPDVVGGTGIAPEASLFIRRVLDDSGSGWDSDVARAVLDAGSAARSGTPTVINMSLGSFNPAEVLRDAVAYAAQGGARVVAARGNSGGEAPFYPVCFEPVVGVVATGPDDRRASWSDHGRCSDLGAPGADITAARDGGGYLTISGTSMAAPQVAGALALLMAIGDADPVGTLQRTAARVADATVPGRLDAAAVLAAAPGPTATAGPTAPGYVITAEPTRNPYPGPGEPTWTATPTPEPVLVTPTRTRTPVPPTSATPTRTTAATSTATQAPSTATTTPTSTRMFTATSTATRTTTATVTPTLCTRDIEVWTRGNPNGWTKQRVLCIPTATRRP